VVNTKNKTLIASTSKLARHLPIFSSKGSLVFKALFMSRVTVDGSLKKACAFLGWVAKLIPRAMRSTGTWSPECPKIL
jgi:hypothetical protein